MCLDYKACNFDQQPINAHCLQQNFFVVFKHRKGSLGPEASSKQVSCLLLDPAARGTHLMGLHCACQAYRIPPSSQSCQKLLTTATPNQSRICNAVACVAVTKIFMSNTKLHYPVAMITMFTLVTMLGVCGKRPFLPG